MFRVAAGTEMTPELLAEYMTKHKTEISNRYQKLHDAYENKYEISRLEKKPDWKPDNRIPVNFAKYITDTMNGFFIGIPVKITCDDEKVSEYLEFLDQYNDQDDNNAELSKVCSIYGNGYEMYYVDEQGNIGITYLTPMDAFMIYDDSIMEHPLFFVRHYKDADNVEWGSWSDGRVVQHFVNRGTYKWIDEPRIHGFEGVPAVEYVENRERMGIFESALPMIDAYNKAISEKANDVDYFADAYLKILGAKLEEEELEQLRQRRIINFDGEDASKLIVEFLQKPNGDTTQENLINRLERLIFQISMVANISDENFGTSSGIALKYKLQAMNNLARTKERKFTSGMNRRYKLIFSNPVSGMQKDAWVGIKYQFTLNYPANILEESQVAGNLSGITSRETQLKVLSVVDNVQKEIERMEEEQDVAGYNTDYPTNRTVVENELLAEETTAAQ
ncbi:MAG TPA: phage portal protein [Candidatus Mediterraneibacter cottocaccae]|nr:phage portal protein [Candidatus Mediterraneibacter cottocaccae]